MNNYVFFLLIQEEPDPPEVVQHTFFVDEVVPPVQHPDYVELVIDHPGDYSINKISMQLQKNVALFIYCCKKYLIILLKL